jgi:hypothetical protein
VKAERLNAQICSFKNPSCRLLIVSDAGQNNCEGRNYERSKRDPGIMIPRANPFHHA